MKKEHKERTTEGGVLHLILFDHVTFRRAVFRCPMALKLPFLLAERVLFGAKTRLTEDIPQLP